MVVDAAAGAVAPLHPSPIVPVVHGYIAGVAIEELTGSFRPDPGYLNTAAVGVLPDATLKVLDDVMSRWRSGRLSPLDFDGAVARSGRRGRSFPASLPAPSQ